jgi:hypothetical protein
MIKTAFNRSPTLPFARQGRARKRIACLLFLAAATVSPACSTDKTQPPGDEAKFELRQDSQGRIVRLNRSTGEKAVIQGDRVTPVAESSSTGIRTATRTAEPSREGQPIAAADQPIVEAKPGPRAHVGETVTTTTDAPIYVRPGYPTPLRVAAVGSVLRVVGIQEDWYEVEFKDPQWGSRIGFVAVTSTRTTAAASNPSEPVDLSIKELKALQLKPIDLSIKKIK